MRQWLLLNVQTADTKSRKCGLLPKLWLADAVGRLAASSTVIVHPIDGLWMAAGDPLRQLKANIALALRRDGMRDDLITYLRSLGL